MPNIYSNVLIEKHLNIQTPSPLQSLDLGQSSIGNNKLWCKRDDLLHTIISGNKWRKLRPLISKVLNNKLKHIGSFGGAYSNHLHALGFACAQLNIQFTAVVRAHPDSPPTPMLKDLMKWGSNIHFVSREAYRLREQEQFIQKLIGELCLDMLIPEGGSDKESLDGVGDIMREIGKQHTQALDYIVLPVASGGTMAGLIKYISQHDLPTKVIGIAVLKGEGYLEERVNSLLDVPYLQEKSRKCWEIMHRKDFTGPGYAKTTEDQRQFQRQFELEQSFALDSIYNLKSFFALKQLLNDKAFGNNKKIVVLNTGGLQGDREKPSN